MINKLQKLQEFAFDFYEDKDEMTLKLTSKTFNNFYYHIHSSNEATIGYYKVYENKEYNLRKRIDISFLLSFSDKKSIKEILEKKIAEINELCSLELDKINAYISLIEKHKEILFSFNKEDTNISSIKESIIFLKENQYDFGIMINEGHTYYVSLPKDIYYKIINFEIFKKELLTNDFLHFSKMDSDFSSYSFHLSEIKKISTILDTRFVFDLEGKIG